MNTTNNVIEVLTYNRGEYERSVMWTLPTLTMDLEELKKEFPQWL